MLSDTTIAALSTAHGKGGIAVIRVSGPEALAVTGQVFFPIGKTLSEIPSNTAVFGNILYNGDIVDTGLVTVFRAPRSFTGEDTAEISCHGSEIGVQLILSALFAAGAVPAMPGEYTKRAFLNGKLSLSQAEAVGELIDAESTASLKLSSAKVRGKLSDKLKEITDGLLMILTSVYAYIDYPDEDIADMTDEEMREKTEKVLSEVDALLATYDTGRAVSHGVPTAVIGAPNVGKSSLMNLLAGHDRAIVTSIAGTTRDVITEEVALGNIRLLLSDTAGIRSTDDEVEKLGVERSVSELEKSELVLCVFDASKGISEEDRGVLERLSEFAANKKIIFVYNKSDLGRAHEKDYTEAAQSLGIPLCGTVSVSARDRAFDELKSAIEKIYPALDSELKNGLILTGARQYAALKKAKDCLESALTALRTLTPDMCCEELEGALQYLYETDGREVNEKIVESIFSHFCVGK